MIKMISSFSVAISKTLFFDRMYNHLPSYYRRNTHIIRKFYFNIFFFFLKLTYKTQYYSNQKKLLVSHK